MRRIIIGILLLLAALGGVAWWVSHPSAVSSELTLYGNVDLRQVSLAFVDSQRIVSEAVE